MKSYLRADKVGKTIQRRVSEIVQNEVRDPRFEMVTVTGVDVSPDLSVAQIYYITGGGEKNRQEARAGFQSAAGFIKKTLAANIRLKYMPEIRFCYDESIDYGERIDRLLEKL